MTCEKKMILRQIEEISNYIGADMELGCGFAPDNAYEEDYKRIDELRDRLARLRGFKNHQEAEEWFDKNIIQTKFGGNYGNEFLPFYI